jgi:hypothetical protein
MARPRLASPDQPAWIRLTLRIYEFFASLQFAVFLIALLAIVLGGGTFVESAYGTEAVKFGVWNTWWFTLLNALLGVSVFCAAAIRYPWKRHQTGFVVTHVGLLVLLAGCLMSQRSGIDAQIPLLEGDSGRLAYEDSHSFRLEVRRRDAGQRETRQDGADGQVIGPIAFRSGPFNWEDYGSRHSFIPWGLAPRDRGVVHEADGIRLEVLDFYADSTPALAPSVKLRIGSDMLGGGGGRGVWMPVDLSWQPNPLSGGDIRHRQRVGGGTVVFWKSASRAETEAFLAAVPDGATGYGAKGQIVLVHHGSAGKTAAARHNVVFRFTVDELVAKKNIELPGTGLTVDFRDHEPTLAVVRLAIRATAAGDGADSRPEEMVLAADLPEVNMPARRSGVYGSLWVDPGPADAAERMQGKARSRIDVIQTHDRKLAYRKWQFPLATAGPLPADGSPVPAFQMPMGKLELRVDRFLPADAIEVVTLPLPFDKAKPPSAKRRAAKLRLSVDGTTEDFWIAGLPIQPIQEQHGPTERREVSGIRRTVAITMEPDAVDIGFEVRLDNFERRLDPGTSQASHFSSVVEFLGDSRQPLTAKPVKITMNAPIDFSDPSTGRSYRLFQESFMGPWLPGDPLYERFVNTVGRDAGRGRGRGSEDPPDAIEASVLTVNYDPGRGVKYAGSALIVAGIFTMFYMKAYFFAPRRRDVHGAA